MHNHAHAHAPGACHGEAPVSPSQIRALRIALVLVSTFSAVELGVSLHSHSLSLLADAGHMVCDVLAIALALATAWLTAQPDGGNGGRLSAIAALINGSLLFLISLWLGWEALGALQSPPTEILSRPVAITAAVGLGINGLNAYLLHSHASDDLNMRAAFLHMLADASSCLGVLVAALLIARCGWLWADGGVGFAIALLIALSAIALLRQSWAALSAPPEAAGSEFDKLEFEGSHSYQGSLAQGTLDNAGLPLSD